jgi:hypothetical protein
MSQNLESVSDVFEQYHAQDKLEGDIKRLEKDIELGEMRLKREEAYLRLENNPDWKEIVEEGFFKDLANGAIKSLGKGQDANIPKEEWVEILSSIGHFQTYLEGIMQFGAQAKSLLPQMKDDLAKLKTQNTVLK